MRRLTSAELRAVRQRLASEQGGVCPLCGKPLDMHDLCLDHDHKTGAIRSVTHRWCNAQLGRIENAANRVGNGMVGAVFVRRCAAYLDWHSEHPSDVAYPTYRTADEKRLLKNKRARAKRAAKKEAT